MTLYSILGCLKYGIGSILAWYCVYVMKSDAALGVMNAVIGTASVPGMLLAPLLAKKIGKRASLLWFNLLRAGFAVCMLFTENVPILFLTAANMLFSLILPWFYEHYGLKNDYDVLFTESVRTPIFRVMIITTVISCLVSVVPMLFYDMTEQKQKQMIADLKERAGQTT